MDPTIYICKKCKKPISCHNIIDGEPLVMCNYKCCMYFCCNIRRNTNGYSEIYQIREEGLCDSCYEGDDHEGEKTE